MARNIQINKSEKESMKELVKRNKIKRFRNNFARPIIIKRISKFTRI